MSNINLFFIPHNPLMISKIGQDCSQKLSSSIKALKDLGVDLEKVAKEAVKKNKVKKQTGKKIIKMI